METANQKASIETFKGFFFFEGGEWGRWYCLLLWKQSKQYVHAVHVNIMHNLEFIIIRILPEIAQQINSNNSWLNVHNMY